jgi:hypothetical protein
MQINRQKNVSLFGWFVDSSKMRKATSSCMKKSSTKRATTKSSLSLQRVLSKMTRIFEHLAISDSSLWCSRILWMISLKWLGWVREHEVWRNERTHDIRLMFRNSCTSIVSNHSPQKTEWCGLNYFPTVVGCTAMTFEIH